MAPQSIKKVCQKVFRKPKVEVMYWKLISVLFIDCSPKIAPNVKSIEAKSAKRSQGIVKNIFPPENEHKKCHKWWACEHKKSPWGAYTTTNHTRHKKLSFRWLLPLLALLPRELLKTASTLCLQCVAFFEKKAHLLIGSFGGNFKQFPLFPFLMLSSLKNHFFSW